MQGKLRISIILLLMVTTMFVTITFCDRETFTFQKIVNVTDVFSLLFNGLLVYYIGTTFVRANDKNKAIREFYMKEILTFIELSRFKLEEIKGTNNDFVYSETTISIQELRDNIQYLSLLNENLLNNNKVIRKNFELLTQKFAAVDLAVNSGRGASSQSLLELFQSDFSILTGEINTFFAQILKEVS